MGKVIKIKKENYVNYLDYDNWLSELVKVAESQGVNLKLDTYSYFPFFRNGLSANEVLHDLRIKIDEQVNLSPTEEFDELAFGDKP